MSLMEVAEVMLARAYEGSRDGSQYSVEFQEVAKELGISDDLARRAVEWLEGRGLVKCLWGMGAFIGHVTGEGQVFVERGGTTGMIAKYRSDPRAFVVAGQGAVVIAAPVAGNVTTSNVSIAGNVTGSTIQAGIGSSPDWDQLRKLLGELRLALPGLPVSAEARADMDADLGAATLLAQKRTPDATAVRPMLQSVERSLGVLDKASGALTFLKLVGAALALLA